MSLIADNSCKLRDVAEKAGLSLATVSQILNNRSSNYSSEETRQRVRQIAKKLGYRTSFGHKLIQGQRTHTVAIMESQAYIQSEEHIGELILLLMNKFDQLGYSVYFRTFTNTAEDNLEKVRDLISRGVEHFVFIGDPIGHLEIEQEIENSGRSLVGFGEAFKRYVYPDSAGGVLAILRFFLEEGRNFRVVCTANQAGADNSRLIALLRLFPELTFEQIVDRYVFVTGSIVYSADFATDFSANAREGTSRIIKELLEVNALYFMNDYMAIGGANYLLKQGFEVGKDMLVAGFNNVPAVKLYSEPISSVGHDLEKIVSLLAQESLVSTPCQHIVKPIVYIRTKEMWNK